MTKIMHDRWPLDPPPRLTPTQLLPKPKPEVPTQTKNPKPPDPQFFLHSNTNPPNRPPWRNGAAPPVRAAGRRRRRRGRVHQVQALGWRLLLGRQPQEAPAAAAAAPPTRR